MRRIAIAFGCLVIAGAGAAPGQDWPHWRGPNYDGSADAKDLPADFARDKRLRWACDLPGRGESTPIVVGDRVFLSSVDAGREQLVALCVRRSDGKVLWSKDAGSGHRTGGGGLSAIARDPRSTYAAPSPTTDGERVVFLFGNGDLVAYDLDGGELWRRNLQKDYGDFAFQWTFAASPTLWEGRIYLPILQRDTKVGGGRGRGRRAQAEPEPEAEPARTVPIESFLLAIDPKTGKTVYKQPRPSPARVESREAYATPIPHVRDGRKELLVVGGDVLTGHEPESGRELWRWGTWNTDHRQQAWRLVPSVVIGGDVALVCAPKRAPVFAVKLGLQGELDDSALVWKSQGRPNRVSSDVPTPACYRGYAYVLSDVEPALSKVDPKDGTVVWTTPMPREHLWRASPTAADGKIWCLNHNGLVVVVDAGDGKIVHRAAMGEEDDDSICSSIVVAHGSLLIRTNSKLFCVGG